MLSPVQRNDLNSKSESKECLLDEKYFSYNSDDTDSDSNPLQYERSYEYSTHSVHYEQEFYYNYWNYPRLPDEREILPTSIRQWIDSYKDPEREFCKVVAIFLFSFIVSLQIFSYVVSMFELYLTIPYCGEVKGQLEFECHLWLFLFAWIACFVCTAVVMVCKYLIWLCTSHKITEKKLN